MLDLSGAHATAATGWTGETKGGVALALKPPAQRFILRGDQAIDAAGKAFGLTIPRKPMTTAIHVDRSALWLGPDEWLLIAEAGLPATNADLTAALTGIPCSLVGVSHRQVAIVVSGTNAATALSMFVPLDLALPAYPAGMATRTIFEKAEIVLWRRGENDFHLEVWRSFVPYVATLLEHARTELNAEAQSA